MKSSAKKFILNWEYYSSFTKLTRHFAWIIKLLKKLLNWKRGHSSKEDFNCLKFKIIQDSRALLFNLDQHESYMKKNVSLSSKQTLDKSSTILSFTLCLDENNYLCVGGRLKHANIPTVKSKNQIILTKLFIIIPFTYKGNSRTKCPCRERPYTLIIAKIFRGLIKKVLSDCIYCCQQFIKPKVPCMGNLTKERLYGNAKPFSLTGIDYAGPIKVKATKYTGKYPALNKQYGVILFIYPWEHYI